MFLCVSVSDSCFWVCVCFCGCNKANPLRAPERNNGEMHLLQGNSSSMCSRPLIFIFFLLNRLLINLTKTHHSFPASVLSHKWHIKELWKHKCLFGLIYTHDILIVHSFIFSISLNVFWLLCSPPLLFIWLLSCVANASHKQYKNLIWSLLIY